jgi:hypothetical protein
VQGRGQSGSKEAECSDKRPPLRKIKQNTTKWKTSGKGHVNKGLSPKISLRKGTVFGRRKTAGMQRKRCSPTAVSQKRREANRQKGLKIDGMLLQ